MRNHVLQQFLVIKIEHFIRYQQQNNFPDFERIHHCKINTTIATLRIYNYL